MREEYSLQRRVIELVLISPGRRGPHPLVGPQTGQGVAKERKQHLFFVETPATRQDRMGVDLQEETETDMWMDGRLVREERRPDGKKRM